MSVFRYAVFYELLGSTILYACYLIWGSILVVPSAHTKSSAGKQVKISAHNQNQIFPEIKIRNSIEISEKAQVRGTFISTLPQQTVKISEPDDTKENLSERN